MRHHDGLELIHAFGSACERLNTLAFRLNSPCVFPGVAFTTGADIRLYANGPKLEKWVEATSEAEPNLFCWWLELWADTESGDDAGKGIIVVEACTTGVDGEPVGQYGPHRFQNAAAAADGLAKAVEWLVAQPYRHTDIGMA